MMPGRHPYLTSGQRPLSAQTALSVILACVIGVLLCIALVSWLLCSQSADTAACSLAAPALPLHGPRRRLRAALRRWRLWLVARQVAETERQIGQYKRLMWDDALALEELRARLAQQQRRQLHIASRP